MLRFIKLKFKVPNNRLTPIEILLCCLAISFFPSMFFYEFYFAISSTKKSLIGMILFTVVGWIIIILTTIRYFIRVTKKNTDFFSIEDRYRVYMLNIVFWLIILSLGLIGICIFRIYNTFY